MYITVTEGHIAVGVPGKSCFCPIAVSLCEKLDVPVGWAQLRVKIMPHVITLDGLKYGTPVNVRRWMHTYDVHGKPEDYKSVGHHDPCPDCLTAIGPFSFQLTPRDVITI